MPLVHVADDALIQRFLRLGIQRRVGQHVLGFQREIVPLLRRAQRRVIGDAAQLLDSVLHDVAPLSDDARLNYS